MGDIYDEKGFLYDDLGRVKEWKCRVCNWVVGRSLLTYPDCNTGIWNFRAKHLKECGEYNAYPRHAVDPGTS